MERLRNDNPFISVVMPVRNEAKFIKKTLDSVLNQNYSPQQMEIIIVDGMSGDGTREIVNKFQIPNSKCQIYFLDNPAKTVPVALNIGIKKAKGNIIIRIDGHCTIPEDYVQKCVEMLGDRKADCVGGLIDEEGVSFIGQCIAIAQDSIFGVGKSIFRVGTNKGRYVDTVAFGVYRKEVFNRIGNFDEELIRNQDDEFNFRLVQNGGKIWFDPSIKVVYYCRENLMALWKQYFQYGFWKVRVFQKRGRIIAPRHLIPPLFVTGIFLGLVLFLITQNVFWLVLTFCPYFFLSIFFSLWSGRKKILTVPFLPLVFFTIHFSYGLGFIWGLWKWRRFGYEFLSRTN